VGDLICKGPYSLEVMQWAMKSTKARCVMGNHEARFLNCWRDGVIPNIKSYDLETYEQFGKHYDRCMEFANSWPHRIDEDGFSVVHAGIDPRMPREKQSLEDLESIRTLRGLNVPWYDRYFDKNLIVFGHWARRAPYVSPNAIGIDTGCVYGESLTALILPEKVLVSVPARKIYREKDWEA
jgi:diadenosine tetraphosphatase ApaH/serine/threonine PP2A family protein phosphatase